MDDMRFECPECGSHMFGSSGTGENMEVHCHGDERISCHYSASHGDPAHWVPDPAEEHNQSKGGIMTFANGYVGPYEVEVWYDPEREIVSFKVKMLGGAPKKRGVKFRVTRDLLEDAMEEVPPGGQYPEGLALKPTFGESKEG